MSVEAATAAPLSCAPLRPVACVLPEFRRRRASFPPPIVLLIIYILLANTRSGRQRLKPALHLKTQI